MARKKKQQYTSPVYLEFLNNRAQLSLIVNSSIENVAPESYTEDYGDLNAREINEDVYNSYESDHDRLLKEGLLLRELLEEEKEDLQETLSVITLSHWLDVGRTLTKKAAETILTSNLEYLAELSRGKDTLSEIGAYADDVDNRSTLLQQMRLLLKQSGAVNHKTGGNTWSDSELIDIANDIATGNDRNAKNLLTLMSANKADNTPMIDLSTKISNLSYDIRKYEDYFKGEGRLDPTVRKVLYGGPDNLGQYSRALLSNFNSGFIHTDELDEANSGSVSSALKNMFNAAAGNIIGGVWSTITDPLKGNAADSAIKSVPSYSPLIDLLFLGDKAGGTSKIRDRIQERSASFDRKSNEVKAKIDADREFYTNGVFHPLVVAKSISGAIGDFVGVDPEWDDVSASDNKGGWFNNFKFYDPNQIDPKYKKAQEENNHKFWRPDYWIPEVGSTIGMGGGMVGSMATNIVAAALLKRLPIWVNPAKHATAYGLSKAGIMASDLTSGIYFTKKSRKMETASEAINAQAERLVQNLSKDNANYKSVMSSIKQSLSEFGVNTDKMEPVEIIQEAIAYNIKTGDVFDIEMEKSRKGLQKLINLNNSLAYSDYLGAVLPFTSYGGSFYNWFAGGMERMGEKLVGSRVIRLLSSKTAEEFAERGVASAHAAVARNVANKVGLLPQTVQKYAPQTQGMLDASIDKLVSKMIEKGTPIGKALATKHALQYTKSVAGKVASIGLVEGTEEGVQYLLLKKYQAGTYDDYKRPYSMFSIPDVLEDIGLSYTAWADLFGGNPFDEYNGDDQLRKAMAIGFLASIGLPVAGGIIGNTRSALTKDDGADNLVGLIRQIQSDYNINGIITDDKKAALETILKDNKLMSKVVGGQLLSVLDSEHAGIFFDSLNHGISAGRLLNTLIDYKSVIGDDDLVSSRFIDDDIKILNAVNLAYENSWIKDHLKKKGVAIGGDEHRELAKDMAQFAVDSSIANDLQKEAVTGDGKIRSKVLDRVRQWFDNSEVWSQDQKNEFNSEHPFVQAVVSLIEDNYDKMLPYQINNAEALAEARRKYVEDHYKDFWDTNADAGTNEKAHRGIKGKKNRATRRLLRRFNKSYDKISTVLDYDTLESYDEAEGYAPYIEAEAKRVAGKFFDSLVDLARKDTDIARDLVLGYMNVSKKFAAENIVTRMLDYIERVLLDKVKSMLDDLVKANNLFKAFTGADIDSSSVKSLLTTVDKFVKDDDAARKRNGYNLEDENKLFGDLIDMLGEDVNDLNKFVTQYVINKAAHVHANKVSEAYAQLLNTTKTTPEDIVSELYDKNSIPSFVSQSVEEWRKNKEAYDSTDDLDRTQNQEKQVGEKADDAIFNALYGRIKDRIQRRKIAHRVWEQERPVNADDIDAEAAAITEAEVAEERRAAEEPSVAPAGSSEVSVEMPAGGSETQSILDSSAGVSLRTEVEGYNPSAERRRRAAMEVAGRNADAEAAAEQHVAEQDDRVTQEEDAAERSVEEHTEQPENTAEASEEPTEQPEAQTATPAEGQAEAQVETPSAPQTESSEAAVAAPAQQPEGPQTQRQTLISIEFTDLSGRHMSQERQLEVLLAIDDVVKGKSRRKASQRAKFGTANRVVTRNQVVRALLFLRQYFGGDPTAKYVSNPTLSTIVPMNPHVSAALGDLAIFCVEGGARTFVDFAKAMLDNLRMVFSDEELEQIAYNQFEDLYIGAIDKLEQLGVTTSGTGTPPEDNTDLTQQSTQQGQESQEPAAEVRPAENVEDGDTTVEPSDQPIYKELQKEAAMDITSGTELTQGDSKDIDSGVALTEASVDIVRDEQQFLSQIEYGIGFAQRIDVQDGTITIDGTQADPLTQSMMVLDFEQLMAEEASGIINHASSVANGTNGKYATRKVDVTGLAHHTFNYRPDSSDALPITDGDDEIKLEHPISTGKKLAENLIKDGWFESTKKYYVITRYDKNDTNTDSFKIHLILDDGVNSYVLYLPTLESSSARVYGLESLLRLRLGKRGTIFEDERNNEKVREGLFLYEKRIVEDIYSKNAVYDPKPSIVVDTRGFLTKESIKEQLLWSQRAMKWYKTSPERSKFKSKQEHEQAVQQWQLSVKKILERARMQAAKPNETPATDEQIDEEIEKLRQVRNQIIDATLQKTVVNGETRYAFPDSSKTYPTTSEPEYVDVSNGQIDSVKNEFGEPVYRKVSTDTAEDITRQIRDGELVLGLGLGLFSKTAPGQKTIRTLGGGDVLTGNGRSGKIYWMVKSRDGMLRIPIQLAEQKFNTQQTARGDVKQLVGTHGKPNVTLTINPETGIIDTSKCMPSAAEVLLYLICGKRIMTNDGLLNRADKNLLFALSRFFVNNGEMTLLHSKSRQALKLLTPFAQKQIAYYTPEGSNTPIFEIAFPVMQNDTLTYQAQVFDNPDVQIFGNTEEAINNRARIVTAIANQLHWNTEEDDMIQSFSKGPNASIVAQLLRNFFMSNPQESVSIGGCPQLTFNRSDLFDENINPKNVTVGAWMLSTGRLFTDVSEQLFKDPFVFAHGVRQNNAKELVQNAKRQNNQPETAPVTSVVEQQAALAEKIDRIKKKSAGKFNLTQTPEDKKTFLEDLNSKFSSKRFIDVLALDIQARGKKYNDIKTNVSNLLHQWARQNNVNIDEIDFQYFGENIVSSNLLRNNGYPLVRVYEKDGKTIAEVSVLNHRTTLSNVPTATGVYSKNKGEGKLDERKARKWLRDVLGLSEKNVVVEDAIMRSTDGEEVYGLTRLCYDAIVDELIGNIHLSRSNGRNVEFHEAWHYVNLLLHNKQQRKLVWASYIKLHPELADKTYQEIEELVADEFKEYMTIRTSYKPTALLRRLYDNVLSLLSASRRKSAYRHVFQEIRKGMYKGMKLDQNSKKEFLRRYPGGAAMRGYIPTVEMSITDSMDTMETYHDFYDTSASVINHIMSQLDIRSLNDIKKMSGKNFSETLNLVKQFAEMQPEGSVARDRIMTLYNNPLAFLNEIFARMAKFGINAKIKNFDGIGETELAEELEEDAGLNYDRVEMNISKKENIGLEAKLFMSRIPKLVRVPGEDEPVQSIDDFGVPEVYDFDEVWGAVLDNLGPCQSFGELDGNGDYKKNSMLGVSQRMGRANLLMRSVYNELSSLTDPYFLQTALKQALFGTINSSKPNIQYVVINDPKNASFMSMEEQMIAMEYGQQQTPYEKTADVKRELSLFNDNRFHVARHITGRWSKNAVLQGIQELKDGKAVVSEQFVSKLCDILGCTVENAARGRFFSDIKQDSLLYNVQKLIPTKTNILSEDEIADLVYTVKELLNNLLTQMGIESDPDVIETLITMLSDSDSMTPRTQASTLEKMLKSVDKNGGTLLSIIRIMASSVGKTELDTGVKDGKPIDEVFNRYKFGTWISTLAMAYNSEHPSSAEYSVIGPDGNMKYPISQNNYVSDVHNALNNTEGRSNNIKENDDKISYAAKMMRSPYCRHSIVLLAAMELNDKSLLDDRIKLYAFIGFKDGNSNEGEDYFAMSAVEDYIAKMLILESDHVTAADRKNISKGLTVDKIAQLILPTMADKKSYFTYGSRNIKLSHDVITVGESPMLRKSVQKQYFESEILPRITEEEASKYEKLLPTEKDTYIESAIENLSDEARAELEAEIGYVQHLTSNNSFSENTLNRFMGYFKDEVDALIQYYDKKNIAQLVKHPGDVRENFHGKIKNGRMDFSGNGGLFRYFYNVKTYTDANGVQYNMNQKLEALWKLLKLIESGKVKLADAKQSDLLKYVNISSLGDPAQLDGFELIRAYLKNLSEASFGKDGRTWNKHVRMSINESLMKCVDNELYRLSVDPAYDIVRYTGTGYDSVALPHQLLNNYIDDMANLGLCPSGSFETQVTDWVRENAVRSLIANNVVNTITSVIEYEKIFHGDPSFYKQKGIRGKNGKLKININGDLNGNAIDLDVTVDNIYDKFSDKIKRLGGNESPGQELCLDYTKDELQADMDVREDFLKSLNILNPRQMNTSKYTILHLEDCSATSLHIEYAVRLFKVQTTIDFIRAKKVLQFDDFAKSIQKEGLIRTLEQVIDILYTKPKVFDNFWKTIDEDVRKEIMSNVRAQIKPFTDITVADAQVFIRPEMYRQIRIDLGEWSTVEDESGYSDERAYQILETNPNWMNEPESARIVARLSLYPLKMSYFQNDNENLGTQSTSVPAYNKMAIFPIFKYTASTPLGQKIYDRMNRNFNEIDMLAFKSAVKVGGVLDGVETVSKDALQELCYINSIAFEMSTDEVQQEIAKLYMKKGVSESAAQQKASEYTASKIAQTCKEYKQHIAEQTSFIDDKFLLDSDKYVDCSVNDPQTKEDTSNCVHVLVQDLKNLRLQLNTKAHKHLERSLGTQLLKTAFLNIFDECHYGIGREGKAVRSGKQIKQDVIDCVDALTVAGVKKIHNRFYNKDKVDHGKVSRWTQQVAKNNGLGIAAETILKSGGAIASLLSSKLFEQTMVKAIQKEVVDVSTNGGTAIQQSCYGFAAYGKDSVSEYSEQGYHQYNGGKELNWVCESSADGQSMRRGSMEVLLSMNFFKNVIPQDIYSQGYTAQRQWLIDHDIISGTKTDGSLANPSPFGIGYRIPTLGPSSLFAFTVADVLPDTSADIIIVPREFTAQTGSDFDVDKLYLATMSYTDGVMDLIQFNYDMDYIESVGEEYALSLDKDQFRQNVIEYAKKKGLPTSLKDLRSMKRSERINFLSKQTVGAVRNRLLQNYMDVTTDIKMFGLSRASIDAITNKIYSDLLPYVQSTPLEYISSFEELTPTFQSIKKREFGTGKDGIAPFALNAVNITFTQATHLSLDYGDNPYDLNDLDKSIGEDGISIAAYLSAMINAHVDVAKDPYVFAINVNPATYNHVNLLLRAGKGFKALKFIAQPALKQYATKVLQSKSLYGGNLDGKTPEGGISQITKNAIYNATMAQLVSELKVLHDECAKLLTEEQNKLFITTVGYFGVKASARTVKNVDPRAIDIFNEQLQTEALKNYKNTSKTALELYNATMFQIYTMHAFNKLLANADKLAELVHTSQIDTKKFGNTIPSMLHFMNKYKVFIKTTLGFVITTDRENSIKNNDALQRYFSGLFLNEKLTKTIQMSREMLSQTAFTATHEFGTLLFDICRLMYGTEYDKNDNVVGYKSTVSSDSVETLARAIESVMKYDALVAKGPGVLRKLGNANNRADEGLIDFVFGGDMDAIRYNVKRVLFGDPSAKNEADKKSIVDRLFEFVNYIKQHPDSIHAQGLVANGLISNDILEYLKPFPKSESLPIGQIKLLTSQMNTSEDQKQRLISAFYDLLTHPSERVRKLARDLCIYGYYTSYNQNSRNNFVELIPPVYRVQYDNALAQALASRDLMNNSIMNDNTANVSDLKLSERLMHGGIESIASKYLQAVARNFWYDDNIVPRYYERSRRGGLLNDKGGEITLSSFVPAGSTFSFYGAILSSRVRAGNMDNPMFFKVTKGNTTVLYMNIGEVNVPKGEDGFTKYHMYIAIPKAGLHLNGIKAYEFYANYGVASVYEQNKMPETWAPTNLLKQVLDIVQKSQEQISKSSEREITITRSITDDLLAKYSSSLEDGSINSDIYFEVTEANSAVHGIVQARGIYAKEDLTESVVKSSSVVFEINRSSIPQDSKDRSKVITIDTSSGVHDVVKQLSGIIGQSSILLNDDKRKALPQKLRDAFDDIYQTGISIGIVGDVATQLYTEEQLNEYKQQQMNLFKSRSSFNDLTEEEQNSAVQQYQQYLDNISGEDLNQLMLNQYIESLLKQLILSGVRINNVRTQYLGGKNYGPDSVAKATISAARNVEDYMAYSKVFVHTYMKHLRNGVTDDLNDTLKYSDDQEQLSGDFMQEVFILKALNVKQTYSEIYDILNNANNRVAEMQNDEINTHLEELAQSTAEEVVETAEKIGAGASALALLGAALTDVEITSLTQSEQSGSEGLSPSGEPAKENTPKPLSGLAALAAAQTEVEMSEVEKQAAKNIESGNTKEEEC